MGAQNPPGRNGQSHEPSPVYGTANSLAGDFSGRPKFQSLPPSGARGHRLNTCLKSPADGLRCCRPACQGRLGSHAGLNCPSDWRNLLL